MVPLVQWFLPILGDFSLLKFCRATPFVGFLPNLVDFFQVVPILASDSNGTISGWFLSTDFGSFQMVPILVDIFLPYLVDFFYRFWLISILVRNPNPNPNLTLTLTRIGRKKSIRNGTICITQNRYHLKRNQPNLVENQQNESLYRTQKVRNQPNW